jgi:hypothetical protein
MALNDRNVTIYAGDEWKFRPEIIREQKTCEKGVDKRKILQKYDMWGQIGFSS